MMVDIEMTEDGLEECSRAFDDLIQATEELQVEIRKTKDQLDELDAQAISSEQQEE